MVKKIFITGASGFLGRRVVSRLKDNYEITALLLPDEPVAGLNDLHIVRGDITRPGSLSGLVDGHDTVIHLAGTAGFLSWKDSLSINVDGTRNIMKQAVKAGVIRFIHMSSVAVYGRIPGSKINESQALKKIRDPFVDTKIDAEKIVWKMGERNRIDFTVLRPTTIYGEDDLRFLPRLVENLKAGKFRLIGDGSQPVDLVNVADVAEAVYLALLRPESIGQAYNIAQDKNPSWDSFLREICHELDLPFAPRTISYTTAYRYALLMEIIALFQRRPPRMNRHWVRVFGKYYDHSIEKARQELGYAPSIELIAGIKKCLRESPVI